MADFNSTGPSTLQRRHNERAYVQMPKRRRRTAPTAPDASRVACRNGIERLVGERAQYCTLLATSLTPMYSVCSRPMDQLVSENDAPSKYVKVHFAPNARCADIFPSDPTSRFSSSDGSDNDESRMVEGSRIRRSPHLRKRTPIFRLKSRLPTKGRQVRHPPISESIVAPEPVEYEQEKRSSRWYGVFSIALSLFSLAIFY